MSCDISGLNLAALFIELFNHAKTVDDPQVPPGSLTPEPMSLIKDIVKATEIVDRANQDHTNRGFTVFQRKALHFTFPRNHESQRVNTENYNKHNGEAAFETIVKNLRDKAQKQSELFTAIEDRDSWDLSKLAAIAQSEPGIIGCPDLTNRIPQPNADYETARKFRGSPLFKVFAQARYHYREEERTETEAILSHFLTRSPTGLVIPGQGSVLHQAILTIQDDAALQYLEFLGQQCNIVELLHSRDAEGRTPLHLSLANHHAKTSQRLLALGARLDAQDNKRRNVFHQLFQGYSIKDDKTNTATLAGLLGFIKVGFIKESPEYQSSLKPALHQTNNEGYTPVQLAIQQGQLLCVKAMVAVDPALLTATTLDAAKNTVFHLATQPRPEWEAKDQAEDRSCAMLSYLMQQRPDFDINSKNGQGKTCVELAMGLGERYSALDHRPVAEKTFKFLLDHKADINLADTQGNTLLHHLVKRGDVSAVKLLLAHQPQLETLNGMEYTALDCARPEILNHQETYLSIEEQPPTYPEKKEHEEIASLLRQHGATEVDLSKSRLLPPATALMEALKQEQQLKSETAKTLTLNADEIKKWEEDAAYVKAQMQALKTQVLYCDTETDVTALKAKYPDHYYFCKFTTSYSGCAVVVFSNPSAEQVTVFEAYQKQLQKFEALKNKFYEERRKFLYDLYGVKKSSVVKLFLREPAEVESALKQNSAHSVFKEVHWLTGFTTLTIYTDLTPEQREIVRVQQQTFDEMNLQLQHAWNQALEQDSKLRQETHSFSTQEERSQFVKAYASSNKATDSKSTCFYLLSPEYYKEHWSVTLYQKLSPEQQISLDNRQSKTRPVILKNRLGWELLHSLQDSKTLAEYLEAHQASASSIKRNILGFDLEFLDLTQADDYVWFVNTIQTGPERLQELAEGDPQFLSHVPFLSVCLVDKRTRGFQGTHQMNPIFPLYLVLDVPPETINYLGATDVGSPYNCPHTSRIAYLQRTTPTRISMDWLQALYQLKVLEKESGRIIPDSPFAIRSVLASDSHFKLPGYKNMGSLPLYTVEGLLKETCLDSFKANSYTEAIILGHTFQTAPHQRVRGTLLLVEKYFFEEFLEELKEYPLDQRSQDGVQAVQQSLSILSNISRMTGGRLKLAMIDTNMHGYKRKRPVLQQFEMLEKEKAKIRATLYRLDTQAQRLQRVGKPIPEKNTRDSEVAMRDLHDLVEWQHYLEALAKDPPLVTQSKLREQQIPQASDTPKPSQENQPAGDLKPSQETKASSPEIDPSGKVKASPEIKELEEERAARMHDALPRTKYKPPVHYGKAKPFVLAFSKPGKLCASGKIDRARVETALQVPKDQLRPRHVWQLMHSFL